MRVLAIDPGLDGALACLSARGDVTVDDLPAVSMGGKGITTRKLDGYRLSQLLRQRAPAGEATLVLLEDVRVMPSKKSGGAANTSLLHTKGVIEGVLAVLRMPPMLVGAQTWKRHFKLIDPDATDTQRKASALALARRIFPECADLSLAKHHNRAEALLLAYYGLTEVAGFPPRAAQPHPEAAEEPVPF